jgi:transcription initiation factor TFIID subunit 2
VDPVLLGIPTYYDIIPKNQTRDLTTIRQKVLNDQYTTVEDVEADLLLMVNNAIAFNGAQSEVGASAYAMQRAYQTALDTFRAGGKKRKDGERGRTEQPPKKLRIG